MTLPPPRPHELRVFDTEREPGRYRYVTLDLRGLQRIVGFSESLEAALDLAGWTVAWERQRRATGLRV